LKNLRWWPSILKWAVLVPNIVVEGRYIAIYEPTDYGAEIVAVVHGMREPSSWLD
jgi:toxin ParE1/3/4